MQVILSTFDKSFIEKWAEIIQDRLGILPLGR